MITFLRRSGLPARTLTASSQIILEISGAEIDANHLRGYLNEDMRRMEIWGRQAELLSGGAHGKAHHRAGRRPGCAIAQWRWNIDSDPPAREFTASPGDFDAFKDLFSSNGGDPGRSEGTRGGGGRSGGSSSSGGHCTYIPELNQTICTYPIN